MADLGRPPTFEGSEGVIDFVPIGNFFQAGPVASAAFDFYETAGNLLWRPRFVSIKGDASGTVGSFSVTFEGLTSSLIGDPWPSAGPLVCTSPTNVGFGETFAYSWSTEVADNYSGFNDDFGRTSVCGMPLVFLPPRTTFQILFTRAAAYDGDYNIDSGMMQVERFIPDTVTGGDTRLADIYLLPQGR